MMELLIGVGVVLFTIAVIAIGLSFDPKSIKHPYLFFIGLAAVSAGIGFAI